MSRQAKVVQLVMDNLGLARLDTCITWVTTDSNDIQSNKVYQFGKKGGTSYSVQEYTIVVESFTTTLF
jgi:hypothetical protein